MIRRPPGSTLIDTLFPDTTLFRSEGGRAILALLAMRRAVLSGALPAAEQHPRLAAHDRGRPAGGSLRAVVGDQYVSRDLRRSEEHTSELQSLMRTSYAVFCLKKKN